jgi:hypothetical protein
VSRGITVAVAVLLAAGIARPARAEAPVDPALGFTLGARVSAAFPMGSVLSDPATGALLIDELVAVSIPLQLEGGVTIHQQWMVGAYVQYAWSVLQMGSCKVGESCSVTGLRVGIQAAYALHPDGGLWFGLGTGWEWMFNSYRSASIVNQVDVSGWEIANLQAGWDVEVSPAWKVGPFFSGSVGEFSRATVSFPGQTAGGNIPNKAIHGWLQIGVKGSFSL